MPKAYKPVVGYKKGVNTPYIPKKEFISDERTQIFKTIKSVNAPTTIYTVPEGKTLYITSLFLSSSATGLAGTYVHSWISITGSIYLQVLHMDGRHDAFMSRDFTFPLEIEEGITITVNASAVSVYNSAGIFGFELKN